MTARRSTTGLAAAARRTGLGTTAESMAPVCAALGIAITQGQVDLQAFDGGGCAVNLELKFTVVSRGRV